MYITHNMHIVHVATSAYMEGRYGVEGDVQGD
jgi:hypothetical protein